MAYKVVDIYKDLPKKAGCSDCGKPGCFAFATAAHLEGMELAKCVHLEPEQLEDVTSLDGFAEDRTVYAHPWVFTPVRHQGDPGYEGHALQRANRSPPQEPLGALSHRSPQGSLDRDGAT